MSSRAIIGWLDNRDLDDLQRSYALVSLAMAGHPGLSVTEAQQAIIEDIALMKRLLDKYQIEPDESVDFSPIDGAIAEAQS